MEQCGWLGERGWDRSEDGLAVSQDRRQSRWCGHLNTGALGSDKLRNISSHFSGKSEI